MGVLPRFSSLYRLNVSAESARSLTTFSARTCPAGRTDGQTLAAPKDGAPAYSRSTSSSPNGRQYWQ